MVRLSPCFGSATIHTPLALAPMSAAFGPLTAVHLFDAPPYSKIEPWLLTTHGTWPATAIRTAPPGTPRHWAAPGARLQMPTPPETALLPMTQAVPAPPSAMSVAPPETAAQLAGPGGDGCAAGRTAAGVGLAAPSGSCLDHVATLAAICFDIAI